MISEPVSERLRLAQKLLSVKQNIAKEISNEFFVNHPEWIDRYGDRGREFCTADACFNIEFLAGAFEAGSPDAFADYLSWTTRMLSARGIAAHSLEENLSHLEKHLLAVLLPDEHKTIAAFLALGRKVWKEPESVPEEPTEEGLDLTRKMFLSAILGGHRRAALGIVEEALRDGHSHVDVYVDVFTEALHRVGELWELNKISVAQEHMATSITQYAIANIYRRLVPDATSRGSMIVTGVSGELHQIGANLVADAMEAKGWAVHFLGSNVPHSAVLLAVEEDAADVLCISTTIVANLPSVTALVQSLRSELGERAPKIILGGGAHRLATQFASDIGVQEALVDLKTALAVLCA